MYGRQHSHRRENRLAINHWGTYFALSFPLTQSPAPVLTSASRESNTEAYLGLIRFCKRVKPFDRWFWGPALQPATIHGPAASRSWLSRAWAQREDVPCEVLR
jgi:hypothetical protein